jgi:hypothetical protein
LVTERGRSTIREREEGREGGQEKIDYPASSRLRKVDPCLE